MAAGLTAACLSANAAQDPGKKIFAQGAGGSVPACSVCHGDRGQGNAQQGYPVLAELQAQYLVSQLQAFASGARRNRTMAAIAKGLSPQQMRHVANYAASLPRPTPAPLQDKKLVESGRMLFHYGKERSRDDWLPACYLCHGRRAQGAGDVFPPLANQHASYIASQLQAWKSGQRSNDPQGLMMSVAARLDVDDIKAVAAYLASHSSAPEPLWPYESKGSGQ